MNEIRTEKTTVMVTHRVPGFHYWPGAPPEVSYLSHRHRHMFLIIASVVVSHSNREVEFHTLQNDVRRSFRDDGHDFGSRSCEMIARELASHLGSQGYVVSWVEAWEDGENGSRVELAETSR